MAVLIDCDAMSQLIVVSQRGVCVCVFVIDACSWGDRLGATPFVVRHSSMPDHYALLAEKARVSAKKYVLSGCLFVFC